VEKQNQGPLGGVKKGLDLDRFATLEDTPKARPVTVRG